MALVVLLACAAAREALAQAPPAAQRAQIYSPYEQQTIAEALASLHAQAGAEPRGQDDRAHRRRPARGHRAARSAPGVAQLLSCHDVARPSSAARCSCARDRRTARRSSTRRSGTCASSRSSRSSWSSRPSAARRIGSASSVITKDVWSLRASWDVVVTSGGLEELELHPEERNLFGRHQTVSATFLLQPSAYTLGLGYVIPRIDTSRIAVVTSADVMINRASGSPEGSFGSLVAGQPLYSALTEWAWDATTSWQDIINRRYVNASLGTYVDPVTKESVPFEWRAREYTTFYELRRSFGWDTKHDFTLGVGIDQATYRTDFPGASPRTVADFEATAVPVSDTRVGPAIQYETYTKRYLRVIDFDTLALQEDYRLGHDIVLAAAPSFRALGSSLDLLSLTASAQYTFAIRDGLFRFGVITLTEPTPEFIAQAYVEPFAHLVTPTIAGLGRIVVDGAAAVPVAQLPEPDRVPRRRRSASRVPDELLLRQGLRRVQRRVPVAARRDPVVPARGGRLLRRGRRVLRVVELRGLPVGRRRAARALPAARSRRLPRRHRLPHRAADQRGHRRADRTVCVPPVVRPGDQRADRRPDRRLADRASRGPRPVALKAWRGPGNVSCRRRSSRRRARRPTGARTTGPSSRTSRRSPGTRTSPT